MIQQILIFRTFDYDCKLIRTPHHHARKYAEEELYRIPPRLVSVLKMFHNQRLFITVGMGNTVDEVVEQQVSQQHAHNHKVLNYATLTLASEEHWALRYMMEAVASWVISKTSCRLGPTRDRNRKTTIAISK